MFEIFEPAAEDGGQTLRLSPANAPARVFGDRDLLMQMLSNLVENGLRHCPRGSRIAIVVDAGAAGPVLSVSDNGPGIAATDTDKVFRRFYSQRPAEHFGNNSGLGLAISKQIVEAHGGVIWAENIRPTEADITSEPLGARFVVGLPV